MRTKVSKISPNHILDKASSDPLHQNHDNGESRLTPLPACTSNVVVQNSGEDNNTYARLAFCRKIPEIDVLTALATTASEPARKLQTGPIVVVEKECKTTTFEPLRAQVEH